MASLVTVQMQGLVAGDEIGAVSTSNPPTSPVFKQVVDRKSSSSGVRSRPVHPPQTPMCTWTIPLEPWTRNSPGNPFLVWSPTTQHVFAQLDNEPELWEFGHLEVQGPSGHVGQLHCKDHQPCRALQGPVPRSCDLRPGSLWIRRHLQLAKRAQRHSVPAAIGSRTVSAAPSRRLQRRTAGRLVDVYDFHWYPEATDGSGPSHHHSDERTLTDAQVSSHRAKPAQSRDTTYTESSWITGHSAAPLTSWAALQSRIAAGKSGMRLSITEYNNGRGASTSAGAIAQADNLGIFGAQGLFAANLWPLNSDEPYTRRLPRLPRF